MCPGHTKSLMPYLFWSCRINFKGKKCLTQTFWIVVESHKDHRAILKMRRFLMLLKSLLRTKYSNWSLVNFKSGNSRKKAKNIHLKSNFFWSCLNNYFRSKLGLAEYHLGSSRDGTNNLENWSRHPRTQVNWINLLFTIINRKVAQNRRVQMIIMKAKTTIQKRTIVDLLLNKITRF